MTPCIANLADKDRPNTFIKALNTLISSLAKFARKTGAATADYLWAHSEKLYQSTDTSKLEGLL